jgi:hypothetical protein
MKKTSSANKAKNAAKSFKDTRKSGLLFFLVWTVIALIS